MKINIPHNHSDKFFWTPKMVDGTNCVRLRPARVLDAGTLFQNREEDNDELHTPTS